MVETSKAFVARAPSTPRGRARLRRGVRGVKLSSIGLLSLVSALACSAPSAEQAGASEESLAGPLYKDVSQPVQARVEDLLARMSLDEKLGQMTQPDRLRGATGDRGELDPNEVTELRLGSMLAGGDMAPTPATPAGWADSYDRYQRAALATPLGIPMLYAVDAVHGDANVLGATVFPHNIGLGSSRDPALVERIGRATAEEISATGLDWTYSPCVAVSRDDHWGRVYESFGEVPEIPSAMTSLITGLQGTSLANPTSVLATAKHYMGDGGTNGGKDEGETTLSEADLRAIHLPPFKEAIRRNVGAIMASYSSWNGTKMHANQYLVNGVLKGELGFRGIVITDWDAIELLDGAYGFSPADVRAGVNAGIDVFMITEQYRNFINLLRAEVVAGRVSMARIDDANRRILTKKFELGLFEHPLVDRSRFDDIGSASHRALAREAVQKSQVVLKNDGNVLPLSRSIPKLFVAGKSADNVGYQSGGWTVKWQGTDGPIPGGTSILTGIRHSVSAGTQVTFDRDGNGIDSSYSVAIAIVGEKPYAEYEGDRTDDLKLDATDLAVLAKLKSARVPTVVVLVSGRPLDVSAQIGDWAGFVAAWLPGSEGAGVADVLFGAAPATGKLPVTWLRNADQEPINSGDGKTGLFPLGYGLTYPATPKPARDPRAIVRAESFDGQQGTQLEACTDAGCGNDVAYVSPGDFLYFDDVDFGASTPPAVEARVASAASSGTIEYRLDGVSGPLIATMPMSSTGGWQTWTTKSVSVTGQAMGRHRLYLVFSGPGGDFVNLGWFRFAAASPAR
jgi:beta-glucosidase